jgi:hypothetical protein
MKSRLLHTAYLAIAFFSYLIAHTTDATSWLHTVQLSVPGGHWTAGAFALAFAVVTNSGTILRALKWVIISDEEASKANASNSAR